jgi:pimeloyl-ACP methyl ester carboxylesterase
MKEKYLKNKIFYRKNEFSPKKKTLVFVHGLSGSSSAWIHYEKKFKEKFNFLAFDLRGHGKSFRPKTFQEYSIKKFSEDLYNLLKHEKISNFILVGHSFGNLIILEFLKKHQKIVKSVIFISADYAPSKRKISKILTPLFLINPLIKFFSKKNGGHIDYSHYIQTGDWNLRRSYADIKNTGIKSYIFATEHAYKFNAEKLLPEIKIPVLIVHGKKDTIFPLCCAENMASKIKNCKIKVIPNADHIIPLNYFKILSKEIEEFSKK